MSSDLVVINKKTWEIVADDVSSWRTRKQDKAWRAIIEARNDQLNQPDFTCSNMEGIKEVIRSLDEKYCGYLLVLQCYADYKDKGGLLVKSSKSLKPMERKDIQKALGLKERAFIDFFKAMTENQIILKTKNGFKINEKYHWKGNAKVKHFIKSYTKNLKDLYKSVNAKDLGFVYKLLPYVHYETNLLCHNPNEKEISLIEPFNKADLAKVTGISAKTAYNKLKRLKLDNMYVFAEVRKGNNKIFKINPFIFYRKNGKPDNSLMADFMLKSK